MGLVLALFGATNVYAQSTVELPYSITFDSTNDVWTVLDASPTHGTSWEFNNDWGNDGFCIGNAWTATPSYCIRTDSGEPNDYYVSPSFSLKEGKSYTITVDAASGPNNELNLILDYFVGSKSADNQKTIEWIGSKLPATVGESGEVKNQWTLDANKDGVYLFAFHALNWGANNANDAISIYSVKIEEKADGEPDAPVALPYEVSFDQTLGSIELNTVYDRDPSTFEFSVQESGNYYVAFHISDSEGANAYGYIFDFSLAEKEGAAEEPVATAPVANLAAAEIATAKSVELTWTNPTKDVDGKDLPADAALTVKVYEGEELLATQDAQAPGSEGTYTKEYTADTFAGEHSYKVVVVYKEKESEAATATLTVVVDAINGVLVPADAKVSVHTLGGAAVGNNLSTLGKGTYIVTVKIADGTMKTVKVTK